MNSYQVIARKYRPKFFKEVVGQKNVITTLLNSLRFNRVGHAYLFSGSRGTGKTTLARLFAKALNCFERGPEGEPCNKCPSCVSIAKGSSLAVLEIDGASNRGIEEMRRLQETIALLPAGGSFKIYLIDEVHMLTKEAFNALLKSLEEPPAHVKFFFATTEPEKIPLTILSRCQRFQLGRLLEEEIVAKLELIAHDLGLEVDKRAFERIAKLGEGSLRDAESLFDELYAFYGKNITLEAVERLFGLLPKESFFELDRAIAQRRAAYPFELAEKIFIAGRSAEYFLEELTLHFRTHLLFKKTSINLSPEELAGYKETSAFYTEEQCLDILEILANAAQEIRHAFSPKSTIELLLVRIARVPQKMNVENLLLRLHALEERLNGSAAPHAPTPRLDARVSPTIEKREEKKAPPQKAPKASEESIPEEKAPSFAIDPQNEKKGLPESGTVLTEEEKAAKQRKKSQYDTTVRFAAKELSGTLKMENNNNKIDFKG